MKVTLDSVCESIADGDHQAPPKSTKGIPFITISCLDPDGGKPDFASAARVPREYYDSLPSSRRAQPNDVLISVVGSLGIPYLVAEGDEFVFQRHIAILRPGTGVLPEYLYYLLKSPSTFHYIDSVAQGAAQRTLTLAQLRAMEVEIPPLQVQRDVVARLKPYDTLIENNRKQIVLLEEAAQRLYKEWFVDLRFPGYQSVKLVNGLPNGWKKTELGSLFSFRRGKTIKKSETEDGLIPVIAGGLTPAYYHSAANTVEPVVTISGSGANAGFTQIHLENVWASDCSYIDSTVTSYIFFAYLSAKVLGDGFKQMQRGSAQPHVYPKDVNALNIVLPDETTLSAFEEFASAIYSIIRLLRRSNTDASEARNRLLSKLMSGEIEV